MSCVTANTTSAASTASADHGGDAALADDRGTWPRRGLTRIIALAEALEAAIEQLHRLLAGVRRVQQHDAELDRRRAVAVATRQRPAASVKPVLSPVVPG